MVKVFSRIDKLDIKIRTLIINDYDKMVELWEDSSLESRPRGRDSKKAIEAQMKANPEYFIGAFEGSRLVGTVIASDDGRKGWVNRLAVDPEFRRRGIAKVLIAEAEKVLQKNGIKIFSALIMDRNWASKELFRKLGYEELEDVKYFSKKENKEV
jgi:ribosomal protein S18 acetylase RimI-like enzyme